MTTIRREIEIDVPAEDAWDALRDFSAVHERLAPGFLVGLEMDGEDTRIVTFANGMVAHEVLVGIDDEARRLAYAVRDYRLAHHSASAQIVPNGRGGCRFIWITDVLPAEAAGTIHSMMEQGSLAAKRALERAAVEAL